MDLVRALRLLGAVACLGLAAACGLVALNVTVLHGFAPACSDGTFDGTCGLDWQAGLPWLVGAAAALGSALVAWRAERAGTPAG